MATVTISNSPVHQSTVLTGIYGQVGQYWPTCGYHTGTDFARNGYTALPEVFAVCTGTYIKSEWTSVLGNQVVIQDSNSGMYWRYCHLSTVYSIATGTPVNTGTALGVMGETGSGAHGVHLHLEYSTAPSWGCAYFQNPSSALGIPNVSGTVVEYNGSVPPIPPPVPSTWIYQDAYNSQSEKENNANIVINLYRSLGINDDTIAGILGNMDSESTIQPHLTERGGGGGYRNRTVDA